jgi:hypothetical protein
VAVTDDLLPCGRDALSVWDDADEDNLDVHEQICPYCQGVVSEHKALVAPVREWRMEPVQVPPALLERVMANVRANLRARNYLPLVSPHGPVRLDTRVAAAVLRSVVDQVDGARARTCRLDLVEAQVGAGSSEPARTPVAVRLTIVARTDVNLPEVADQVRQLIGVVGAELLGLDIVTVDIHVVDVYPFMALPELPDSEGTVQDDA